MLIWVKTDFSFQDRCNKLRSTLGCVDNEDVVMPESSRKVGSRNSGLLSEDTDNANEMQYGNDCHSMPNSVQSSHEFMMSNHRTVDISGGIAAVRHPGCD